MIDEIVPKLRSELEQGIRTEVQVVYLLTGIRKILEQDDSDGRFQNLKEHADWVLHSRLKGEFAQRVLTVFAEARPHFIAGTDFHDLPEPVQSKVHQVSNMQRFREELSEFLQSHDLPDFISGGLDNWTHFLHLYAKVIKDCPLVIRGDNNHLDIAKVTIRLEMADKIVDDQVFYKIIWNIEDRDGKSGEFFVINSFTQQ